MKKLLLLPFLFLLFSCSENNLLDDNASDNPSLRATSTVNIPRLTNCIWKYNLKSEEGNRYYALAVPHAFYPGATEEIDGNTYSYLKQPFSVFKDKTFGGLIPLYRRHLSGNKFRLITTITATPDPKTDAFLGYVYANRTAASTSLVEYQSQVTGDYEYAASTLDDNEMDTDSKYIWRYTNAPILGFVLPGDNFDIPSGIYSVYVKPDSYWTDGKTTLHLEVTTKELYNNMRVLKNRYPITVAGGSLITYESNPGELNKNEVLSIVLYIERNGEKIYAGECYSSELDFTCKFSDKASKMRVVTQRESRFLFVMRLTTA